MTERKLMSGNEALAEAAILAGLDAYFGYPITPQNEVPEYMSRRMPEEERVFVQSESELAAINMVFGASAAGARAMTSSSSPGISLMQEGISYLATAKLPAVIVNIMRGGPGLGNIGPSQSDYFQATRGGGHGDYRTITLGPASVQELADLVQWSFDLADKYRTPVMVLGDGVLGQMMEPVMLERRAQAPPAKPWAVTGRGRAEDGSGNGQKLRPQNIVKSLHLGDGVLEGINLELQETYRQIEQNEIRYEAYLLDDAELVVAAYGVMARITRAAVEQARAKGLRVGLFRPITLWPFPSAVLRRLAEAARAVFTVEMSYGQMLDDVRLAVGDVAPVEFYGRAGGVIPTVEEVLEQIERQWAKVKG